MKSVKLPLRYARLKRTKNYKFGKSLPKGTIVVLFSEKFEGVTDGPDTVYACAINKDDTMRYGLGEKDFEIVNCYYLDYMYDDKQCIPMYYAANLTELGARMEKELIGIKEAKEVTIRMETGPF